jgi:N,N'-diacetylchitobiose phosphorylase
VVFGTRKAKEGRIYLNTQCWAVMSGAATPRAGRARARREGAPGLGVRRRALQPSVREDADQGSCGRCSSTPATRRTGGYSATRRAGRSWRRSPAARRPGLRLLPGLHALGPERPRELREIEPYVHCQSTHAPSSKKSGRSRIPWLSGTASWAHYTATQHILGIRPETGGLRVDPCIPSAWPGFTAVRVFRGRKLHIEVRNPAGVCRGVRSLTVDGRAVEGGAVPLALLKDGARIVAELG